MGLTWLLLSTKGRIPRSKFWIAHLGLTFGWVVLGIAYAIATGLRMGQANSLGRTLTEAEVATLIWPPFSVWVMIIALGYMSFCVSAKRLHDRNKSAWWMLLLQVPATLMWPSQQLLPLGGALIVSLIVVITSLWYLIELGFLPGTNGPNRFDGSGKSIHQFVEDALRDDGIVVTRSAAPPASGPVQTAAAKPSTRPARAPAPGSPRPTGFGRRRFNPA